MQAIMTEIIGLLRKKSGAILEEAIRLRRHIHSFPELSFKEDNTSAFVLAYMEKNGIECISGIAGTGLIATVRGTMGDGPVIALRAELDALPIKELNQTEYSSKNDGVMHACGHDAHMAMLMASAKILSELTHTFRGEMIFIFQPGEELVPGGASLLMKEGTLRKKNPAAIIAQHLLPELESGSVGFREGKYMASSDEIYIEIKGKGGHAALPGLSTDQVLIASELVCQLKKLVSQKSDKMPLVLGIGKFIADGATNVIPEKVNIEGTLRTFDEQLRAEVHDIIIKTCEETGNRSGVSIVPEIRRGYPVLSNDPLLTSRAEKLAQKILGNDRVIKLPTRMSSEDFAFYSLEFPVLFYRLGVKRAGEDIKQLHTATFDLDEKAMETGILTLCALAIELANSL